MLLSVLTFEHPEPEGPGRESNPLPPIWEATMYPLRSPPVRFFFSDERIGNAKPGNKRQQNISECPAIGRRGYDRGGIRTRILRSRSTRCLHHRFCLWFWTRVSSVSESSRGTNGCGLLRRSTTELLEISLRAGIEPATSGLAGEVTAPYATGYLSGFGRETRQLKFQAGEQAAAECSMLCP